MSRLILKTNKTDPQRKPKVIFSVHNIKSALRHWKSSQHRLPSRYERRESGCCCWLRGQSVTCLKYQWTAMGRKSNSLFGVSPQLLNIFFSVEHCQELGFPPFDRASLSIRRAPKACLFGPFADAQVRPPEGTAKQLGFGECIHEAGETLCSCSDHTTVSSW